jgi:Tat protein secretion system quality control protein TatD with DNase activity
MDAATSELAQKMLTDPAFAQKFSQMSEKEQHAYIAGLLAEKGIKPANGTPNVNTTPIPGTDVEWAALCSDYMQTAIDISRWEKQTALQQHYEHKHQEVRDWTEAAIKKLPMYAFGEYGHDHDPEQVKAVQKEALAKHRDLAAAMWQELRPMLLEFRQEAKQRVTPLNDALKKVRFGAGYDFGIHYTTVLGAQSMMIQEAHALLDNEIAMINEVAKRELEWRNFK